MKISSVSSTLVSLCSGEKKLPPSRLALLGINLALALAYFTLGSLSLSLTTAPVYSASFWPAAGLALASAQMWGFCTLPGLWLGAFTVELWAVLHFGNSFSPTLIFQQAIIALGPIVQASAGALWLRRWGRAALPLDTLSSVLRFTLIWVPLLCVVSSSWCVFWMTQWNFIAPGLKGFAWLSWWAGDTLGIVLAAPAMWMLFSSPRWLWRPRLLNVGVPVLVSLAVVGYCFAWTSRWEQRKVEMEFQRRSIALSNAIDRELRLVLENLQGLEDNFGGHPDMGGPGFKIAGMGLISRVLGVVGVGFAPRITPENQAAWLKQAQVLGLNAWDIHDLDGDGKSVPPEARSEQYPLLFVMPDKLAYAVGMTLTHEPVRREAIQYAMATGNTGVTSRLYFSRAAGQQLDSAHNTALEAQLQRPGGHYAFRPIFRGIGSAEGVGRKWTQEERDKVWGLLVIAFRLPDLLDKACAGGQTKGLSLFITDTAIHDDSRLLFSSNLPGRDGRIPGGFAHEEKNPAIRHAVILNAGGRSWQLSFASTSEFLGGQRAWTAWTLLALGLLFTSLLSGFLLVITGRVAHTELLIDERTRDLQLTNVELRDAKDAALAASRAKSEFLATMSHEIRTPMNGVLGMVSLLQETPMNEEQAEYLRAAQTSGEGLLDIVNDILDFSKVEAGKLNIVPISFDLHGLCQEICSLFSSRFAEKKIELILDIDPKLPRRFLGDAVRIRQILVNLCGNALKFTHEGHVRLSVSCPVQTDSMRRIVLDVEDSGIGIDSEKISQLFQPFTQADTSTTRRFGGTGLGLAICKRLVGLMDGEIEVRSQVGQGATFSVNLPLQCEDETPTVALALPEIPTLIWDSHAVGGAVTLRELQARSLACILVREEGEALEHLRQGLAKAMPFRFVILVGRHGSSEPVSKLAALRQAGGPNMCLLVFAATHKGESGLLRAAGADAYLVSPIEPDLLDKTLQSLLEIEPIATQAKLNPEPPVPGPTTMPGQDKGPTWKVLLAEDNRVNQKVAQRMLEKLGCEVLIANNGLEALALVKEHVFDAVFMDVQMPECDGYEATRGLREMEKRDKRFPSGHRLPIVAMTANAMQGDKELCLQAGMDDYLSKPVRPDDLRAVVDIYLRNHPRTAKS